ncbi:sugar transferase [Patescibacteria group bacterium]|nr:MAG: sugar transferase [Patescibacteria group bacterium]
MKRSGLFFTIVLLPLDLLALVAAAVTAYYSRFLPVFTSVRPVVFDLTIERYLPVAAFAAFVWLLVFAASGLYTTRRVAIAHELTRVALACSTGMAAVFAILFFSRTFFESRYIAVAAWLLSIAFVCAERLAVRLVQRSLIRWGIGECRVVLIGENRSSAALDAFFADRHRFGFHVTGHFKRFDGGVAERIRELKRKDKVDEVWLTDPEASREAALDVLGFTEVEHLGFRYTADFFASAVGKSVMHAFAGVPVIEVRKTPLDGWGAIYKRAFDIAVSGILIVLTAPVQLAIAVALFLESPGRVLFSRLPHGGKVMRVGQGGKSFHYFKFRSMVKDAHTYRFDPAFLKRYGNMREGSPLFKLKDDPRVTPIGRLLRKFSLDELPEFFLVFLGRMSLVGPRPHLPEEVALYKPHQRKVLTVKPGITGMAQMSGRADLDFDEEVRLDIHYLEHWSPWLDLYLLLKTPLAVIFKKGAY